MLTHVLLVAPHDLERILLGQLGGSSTSRNPASGLIQPQNPRISHREIIVMRRGIAIFIRDGENVILETKDVVALDGIEFKGIVAWVMLVLNLDEREALEIDSRVEIPISTRDGAIKGDWSSIHVGGLSTVNIRSVLDSTNQNVLLTSER